MLALYGGFTAAVYGVYTMKGPDGVDAPVSDAVSATVNLTVQFFVIYLLLAIVRTAIGFKVCSWICSWITEMCESHWETQCDNLNCSLTVQD
jgi:hypothetical protein